MLESGATISLRTKVTARAYLTLRYGLTAPVLTGRISFDDTACSSDQAMADELSSKLL